MIELQAIGSHIVDLALKASLGDWANLALFIGGLIFYKQETGKVPLSHIRVLNDDGKTASPVTLGGEIKKIYRKKRHVYVVHADKRIEMYTLERVVREDITV